MPHPVDLSLPVDEATVATLRSVAHAMRSLNLRYVVVGATARDLVLHHLRSLPISRKTTDVDFGIEVSERQAWDLVVQALRVQGFFTSRTAVHRFTAHDERRIDIVPFGRVALDDSTIRWPPDGDKEMSVRGFEEACEHALLVRVANRPVLDVPVVSPEGFLLLKLNAWLEREPGLRRKDAVDVRHLLS